MILFCNVRIQLVITPYNHYQIFKRTFYSCQKTSKRSKLYSTSKSKFSVWGRIKSDKNSSSESSKV